jgi:hypothetical protein
MVRRVGGLVISRKAGEGFRMDYPNGVRHMVVLKDIVNEGATISIDDKETYMMMLGDSISMPGVNSASQSGIYLESIEGGRCAIRVIADDKIRVLRCELLRG